MNSNPFIEAFCVAKNKIFYYDNNVSAVFSFDLKTKGIQLIQVIENPNNKGRLFGKMLYYNDQLYLIPMESDYLYEIGIENHTVDRYLLNKDIPKAYSRYINDSKFLDAVVYNGKIILIPSTYPAFVEFSYNTKNLEYHTEWLHMIPSYEKNSFEKGIFRKACINDSRIYAPFCGNSGLIKWNLRTGEFTYISIGKVSFGFSGASIEDNIIWFSPRNGSSVVRFNLITEETVLFKTSDNISYIGVIALGSRVYIISPEEGKTIYIDKDDNHLVRLSEIRDVLSYELADDYLFLRSNMSNEFIIISPNGDMKRVDTNYSSIELGRYRRKCGILENEIFIEDKRGVLKEYLDFIGEDIIEG